MASKRAVFALLVLMAICDAHGHGHGHLRIPEESYMRMPELLSRVGEGKFSVHEYMAHTTDGYVLGMYRVQARGKRKSTYLPVLIMHGIVGSSEDFLRMGRNNSLVLSLAEAGYDVWLGNFRGNIYTRHLKISKTDSEFWNYSIDDQGRFDLPAIIELVLSETGMQRLHYVGFSLGCVSFLITCNERPDLAVKIASFVGLAPAMNVTENLRPLAKALMYEAGLQKLLHTAGVGQLGVELNLQIILASSVCAERDFSRNICHQITLQIVGENPSQVDWEKYLVIFARLQPTSLRTFIQFIQSLLSVKLSKYDWGKRGNMKMYRQPTPEVYNNSAIIAPTHIFYGLNDMLIPPNAVVKFAEDMQKTNPNVAVEPIKYPTFNHLDFMFAKDIQNLVNTNVVKVINHFSEMENFKLFIT